MNAFSKLISLVIALTLPTLASAAVNSNQLSDDQVRITYSSDDVATESGRIELERQIRRAAEKVCGAQRRTTFRSIRQLQENRSCFNAAVNDAFQKLDSDN